MENYTEKTKNGRITLEEIKYKLKTAKIKGMEEPSSSEGDNSGDESYNETDDDFIEENNSTFMTTTSNDENDYYFNTSYNETISTKREKSIEAGRLSPRLIRRHEKNKSGNLDFLKAEHSDSSPLSSGPPSITDITPIASDDEDEDRFQRPEVIWKHCFVERLRGEQNWKGGKYTVSTLKGHSLAVMCVKFRDNMLYSGSLDGTLKKWDIKTKKCVSTFTSHKDWVNYIDFDDEKSYIDTLISCSYDTSVKVWNVNTTECLSTLWGHQNIVWAVKVCGNRALSCSSDSTIKLWDIEAGICVGTMGGHAGSVYCFDVDWTRNVVVSGSVDKTIRFWDLNSIGDSKGGCLHTLTGHDDRLCCLQYDGDLSLVVSGSRDSTIKMWDVRNFNGSKKITSSSSSSSSSFSSSSSSLKNKNQQKQNETYIEQHNNNDKQSCLRTLRGHKGRVCCLQFDDYKVVSGSDDNEIKVWPTTGNDSDASSCITTLKDHDCWVNSIFFADNRLVSGAADDTIKIWDFSQTHSQRQRHSQQTTNTFALKQRCHIS